MKQSGELDIKFLSDLQKSFEEILILDHRGFMLDSDFKKIWDVYPFPQVIKAFEEAKKHESSSCKVSESGKTFVLKFARVGENIVVLKRDVTLEEKIEEIKKNTIAVIYHEIKTPLTVALGNLEFLITYGNLKDKEILSEIFSKLKETLTILDGIEVLFKGNMNFDWINLRPITENVLNEMKEDIFKKNLSLRKFLSDVNLPANRILYEQMLKNILKNAVNFTDKGEIKVELNRNFLKVSDSGMGIDEELLPKIFDRFVKGKESKGSGVGLSIVKSIVKFHGWEIEVKSKKGKGTEVIVYFKPHIQNTQFPGFPQSPT